MSKAIRRASSSSLSLADDSEPTNCVSSDLRTLIKLSHMIQLGCFKPSSAPTATCVDNPSPTLNIGAHTTVENLESISTCRLTITNERYCLGSPPGLCTR